MLSRVLYVLCLAVAASFLAPSAIADTVGRGDNCVTNPLTGQVTCSAIDPGTAGGRTTGSVGGGCSYKGQQIPCVAGGAHWFSSQSCYASPGDNLMGPGGADAPPPKAGEQGQWWQCVAGPNPGTPIPVFPWFVPTGATPVPDPATLAKRALGQMQLATAQVGTAPSPPNAEVVGVEVWLWVPQSQWQTLMKTVTAGATAVTATAVPTQVAWNMGDASQPTICGGAGRAWLPGYTDSAVTDCGYTYQTVSSGTPGGVFPIKASISYAVTWTCTGTCTSSNGDLGLVAAPAGTGSIKSVQRQTVVIQR